MWEMLLSWLTVMAAAPDAAKLEAPRAAAAVDYAYASLAKEPPKPAETPACTTGTCSPKNLR